METLIFEDIVECESCGADIVHLVIGKRNSSAPGYYTCESCDRDSDAESQAYQDAGEAAAHVPGSWA